MSKKPAFASKTTEDMYRSLDESENDDKTPAMARRPARVMDPYGPFRGDLTRERVQSMTSNVEMEDVSGAVQFVNAQEIPKHPIFSGSTTEDKREFILKYNEYWNSLLPFNTTHNSPLAWPVSACIEPWVKDYIANYEIGKPVNEISEQEWMEHFRACLVAERKDLRLLDERVAKFKLDLTLGDASSMMASLGMKIFKAADELGLKEFVQENDPKRMVKYVVEALEPPAFKERIRNALALDSNKDLRKNPVAAYAWIRSDLRNFLEYVPQELWKAKSESRKESSASKRQQGGRVSQEMKPSPVPAMAAPLNRSGFSCLKCRSKDHHVRDCPQCRAGEAESLLKQYRDQKLQRKNEVRRVTRPETRREVRCVQYEATNGTSGRLKVQLEHCVDTEALLDSGADCALISRGLIDQLEQKVGFLKMKTFHTPQKIGTAGDDIQVSRLVCLDSLVFQTSAGPLRWRNLQCWVDENDPGQLLVVDRPTMEKMGYSADALLVAAKHKFETYGSTEGQSLPDYYVTNVKKPFVRFIRHKDELLSRDLLMEQECQLEEAMYPPSICSVKDQQHRVEEILEQKVHEALESGMSEEGAKHLRTLLAEYQDVFRIAFANDPPIAVDPMEIKLKPGSRPVMARSRRYPPLHRAYLKEHMEELESSGLVYKNPDARWGSAPRVVPKKDGTLRMTVDLRAVNDLTEPRAWPMPHQEAEMSDLEGSTCYFGVDGFKQFWQEDLAQNSREMLSIVTPAGIYTPTRVLMGATDSVAYTQQAMEKVMSPLLNRGVKVWLDDVLGYAATEQELLERLRIVLNRCKKFGLKLHPGKSDFFKTQVKWCGKIISATGVSHCPIRIQGLVDMQNPETAADLQQFLCACNWMRSSIPKYNEVVSELTDLMEVCMTKTGSRKKTKLSKVSLKECGWNDLHDQALQNLKQVLMQMVPLAHPNEESDVCVFTDASQDHWGAVITQIPSGGLSKSREDQQHEPLAFLSGSFKDASSRWPIVEKEAYAIVETCKRMEYLLLRERGFHLFTDHRNLQYIFDPHSVNSSVAKYQADKLQRWSMVLQMFKYEIEYISGADNVWGDLLSRWASRPPEVKPKAVYRLVSTAPLDNEDFKWPTFNEIAEAQAKYPASCQSLFVDPRNKCHVDNSGKVWIPEEAVEIKQRVCIIAHAGLAGHRGINTTVKAIQEVFTWKGMQQEVAAFVNSCLHCLVVDGKRVPRPFGSTLTATKPNESIHFDFLKLPKSVDGYEYVLVVKDAMSGFVELVACTSCTAEACVDALCEWFKRYGPVSQWVSDQGSHFKNQAVQSMEKLFGATHHFVTAYCPWANGTVEVVNRMLLRVLKSMLSEAKLPMVKWSKILFQVQMALNFNPAPRLNGTAPVTAFLALPARTPLKTFYLSKYDGHLPTVTEVEWAKAVQTHIQDLALSLDFMHKNLVSIAAQKLVTKRDKQLARARPPNFEIGDFVLVGRTLAYGNKLALEWKGPCRVVAAKSHWLYDVQTLFEPVVTTTHHVSRLKFYVDQHRGDVEDLVSYAVAHQDTFLVERLLECRNVQDSWQVKVKWQGFDELECTWEPLSVLQADVPALVKKTLQEIPHASFQVLKDHLAAQI